MEVKIVALSFSLLISVHLTYFIVNHLSLMNFSSSLYTNHEHARMPASVTQHGISLKSPEFVTLLLLVTSFHSELDLLKLCSPSSPRRSSPLAHPSLHLLSPCEYFTLLLPLVRDAGDWALIVCTQCGRCGMWLLAVRCVVTGVWLLTPAGRLPVCLSVGAVTPDLRWHCCTSTHVRIHI